MKNKMSDYSHYIAISRYSRYIPEKARRETWDETVDRFCSYWGSKYPDIFPTDEVRSAIYGLEVMPSMRALMTAGKALDRDNVAGYNCSAIAVDDPRAFDEAMYVSMCGTGVGFSVERQFVSKMPEIAEEFFQTDTVIKVRDSKIGWASSLRELISLLYGGQIPKWDLSLLRPAGAPLKTFGGRSSGPAPLNDLFEFTVRMFRNAAGRRLSSIECHDLMCKIGEIVVVGGVRRSAMISLSNLSDDRMRVAKSGQWWVEYPHRALANNSVAYTEKPEIGIFMREWLSLYESKSGERGIFNRQAAQRKAKKGGLRKWDGVDFLTNPCAEISLRSLQFCNLSEVVIRETDTLSSIKKKLELATIIGTLQSTLTNFRYLRSAWKRNSEEERLLGVSLTGIMDHEVLSGQRGPEKLKDWLTEMRSTVHTTNKKWATLLGINESAAMTTVKPSGTVSQLVDSSSGIHPRYSRFYIRTVRNDKKDPLSDFLVSQGVPYEQDVMNPQNWVFSFPVKSPSHCVVTNDMNALGQLEVYKIYNDFWADHNISITVYVNEPEWFNVGSWVYENFDTINGISFLPHSTHIYQQAPYQPISEEKYNTLVTQMPKIDWSAFNVDEHEDNTVGAQQLACVSGVCEII